MKLILLPKVLSVSLFNQFEYLTLKTLAVAIKVDLLFETNSSLSLAATNL